MNIVGSFCIIYFSDFEYILPCTAKLELKKDVMVSHYTTKIYNIILLIKRIPRSSAAGSFIAVFNKRHIKSVREPRCFLGAIVSELSRVLYISPESQS
jgi:hypothetical protein